MKGKLKHKKILERLASKFEVKFDAEVAVGLEDIITLVQMMT